MKGSSQRSIHQQLVNIVATSRYARKEYTDAQLVEIAAKLGVTEQLFREALVLADKPKIFRESMASLGLNVPPHIYGVIKDRVKELNTTPKGFYRSVIYRYLRYRWEPPHWDVWRLNGVRHKTAKLVMKTTLSEAAYEAFIKRVERIGTTRGRVTRSLFLGWLHGHFYQDLEIVTRAKFTNNIEDYYVG